MQRTRMIVGAIAVLATAALSAQNITGLPRVSPHAQTTQKVGISTITVDYHRPSVNGREVFGTLVPYDAVWRAGANDNTTITFSDDATVEGEALAAGTYGLHMIPGAENWTIIFSNNSTSWGSFSYDEAEDALRVEVTAVEAPFQEQLSYGFDDVSANEATVYLHWADRKVPVTVAFDTPALAVAKINNDLRHLPGFNWQGWNSAANYCLQSGNDLEQGLEWSDRSIQLNRNAVNLFVKAGILNALERGDEGKETEQEAFDLASEQQVNAFGYNYLLQRNDVDRAIEIFQYNVDKNPESWNVYDSLAEAQAAKGDTGAAVANYKKAREMAPEAQHARIDGILAGLES